MNRIRPIQPVAAVLGLVLAFAGCGAPVMPASPTAPTPPSSAAAPSTVLASPTATEAASPRLPQASATLEPITLADLGTEGWVLISSDTNDAPVPHTAILGNVKLNFGFVFTCTGDGDVRISITATNSKVMEDPQVTPIPAATWTGRCPTTTIVTDRTGTFDSGGYSLSPSVQVPDGVTYRLLVGTLPN